MAKSPGVIGAQWPNQASVSRSDLDKNTAKTTVKGITVRMSVPKSQVKGNSPSRPPRGK